jgi:hypothetical protein
VIGPLTLEAKLSPFNVKVQNEPEFLIASSLEANVPVLAVAVSPDPFV